MADADSRRLRTHPLDLFSLIGGLLLLATGAGYLLADLTELRVGTGWPVAVVLVALGAAGLLASLRRRADR